MRSDQPPLEAVDNDKVFVWPDLVYIELICMVALMAVLLAWSILLKAPLEEPASTVQTPNPSKAPWYFLGLQEMLVYFDPWMAGVVIPGSDHSRPDGDSLPGCQCEGERLLHDPRAEVRVPDVPVRVPRVVDCSDADGDVFPRPELEFLWPLRNVGRAQGRGAQQRAAVRAVLDGLAGPAAAGARRPAPVAGQQLGYIVLRELPGLVLLGSYFLVLPGALARLSKAVRDAPGPLGTLRATLITMWLLLLMALLPLKMICRWLFNMNYFVSIPECFFNF